MPFYFVNIFDDSASLLFSIAKRQTDKPAELCILYFSSAGAAAIIILYRPVARHRSPYSVLQRILPVITISTVSIHSDTRYIKGVGKINLQPL